MAQNNTTKQCNGNNNKIQVPSVALCRVSHPLKRVTKARARPPCVAEEEEEEEEFGGSPRNPVTTSCRAPSACAEGMTSFISPITLLAKTI